MGMLPLWKEVFREQNPHSSRQASTKRVTLAFSNGCSLHSGRGITTARWTFMKLGFIALGVAQTAFILLYHTNFSADRVWLDASTTSLLTSSSLIGGTWSSPIHNHSSTSTSESAAALPALVPTSTDMADAARFRQGVPGFGDPVHLGGRLDFHSSVLSPRVFELIRRDWGVRSLLDLGCGRGWSTLWFLLQGVNVQCVEASPTALKHSLLPNSSVVNHDFTRGPWWPEETTDLVWSTSFVQQVSRQYMRNYFAAMKKAAILVVSFPGQPGWHHVEVHDFEWWRLQFELQGFRFHEGLTKQVGHAIQSEYKNTALGPDGKRITATDLLKDTQVFINPSVASLPAHAHLFPEPGCYKSEKSDGKIIHRDCNTGAGVNLETPLPSHYTRPKIDMERHQQWELLVRRHLKLDNSHEAVKSDETTTVDNNVIVQANISLHAVMHIPDHLAQGNRTLPKIPVVVWPLWEFGADTAEALHVERNGIEESPFLELSDDIYNFDPNVVWIGDTGYAYGWNVWCGKFNEHVSTAKARRIQLGLPTSWPIYIVDWSDYPERQRCHDVEETVGKDFVFYTTRSIVKERRWDEAKDWVEEGRRIEMAVGRSIVYRHTPLMVRTDIVEHLQRSLRKRGLSLGDSIESLDRPVDLTHLWPVNPSDKNSGVGDVESKLRTKVSKIVLDLGNTTGLNVYVGTAGSAAREGRRGVSSDYVEAMLKTKIMVVTQRDQWEDHYRLFEALISGAMVMTDHMLSLPMGLKNGSSIIEFSSEDQLRSLTDYYLKHTEERLSIAQEGRRISKMRHRTWHRIEEIIFGRALTLCSENSTSGCPYIVHANETSR